MSQIIFKISVLFTFCLLIIVVKKAEIVLTLINDTGKVLNGDFQIIIWTMPYENDMQDANEKFSLSILYWTYWKKKKSRNHRSIRRTFFLIVMWNSLNLSFSVSRNVEQVRGSRPMSLIGFKTGVLNTPFDRTYRSYQRFDWLRGL